MNEKHPDDLLSAYFDGEASPAERAAAERLLEESAPARQEWHETRRLSELLGDLPRRPAPPELRAAVMQQAERATLLADVPARGRRSKVAGWLLVVGGIGATAAAVMLSSHLWLSNAYGPAAVDSVASRGGERAIPTDSGTEISAVDESGRALPFPQAAPAAPRSEPPAASDRDGDGAAEHLAARGAANRNEFRPPGREMSAPAPAAAPGPPAVAGQDDQPVSGAELAGAAPPDLKSLEVGQVVRYLETSGDQVAVVELTVLDVHRAVDRMQILLQSNSIPQMTADADKAERADKKSPGEEDEPPAETGTTELAAVYVEASETQMAAALKEIQEAVREQDLFRDISPPTPVPADAIQVAAAELELPRLTEAGSETENVLRQRQATLKEVAENGRAQRALNERGASLEQVADAVRRNQVVRSAREAGQKPETDVDRAGAAEPRAFADAVPGEAADDPARRKSDEALSRNAFQVAMNVAPRSLAQAQAPLGRDGFAGGKPASRSAPLERQSAGAAMKKALGGQARARVADPSEPSGEPLRVIFVFRKAM